MPRYKRAKRKKKPSLEDFDGLLGKLKQGPFRDMNVVVEPSGEVKMSAVLSDFVEPYADYADNEEEYRRLLMIGVLAWNASLIPEQERPAMVDQVLDDGFPEGNEELKADVRAIINVLLARKLQHFSEYGRAIIAFDLIDTGEGYRLTVSSTLEQT